MAICFKNIFKNSGSAIFMARRSRQTNSLNYKTSSSFMYFAKEIATSGYSSSGSHYLSNFGTNLTVNLTELYTNEGVHDFGDLKKMKLECSNNLKLDCISLGETVYYAKECKAYKEEDQKDLKNFGRPEPDQVLHVFNVLSHDLPQLFHINLNYSIYHPNIILENNIRGTTTTGLFHYVKQVALLKTVGHIKFALVKFEILKITAHPEDGTVKVRWRIRGIPNYKVLLSFLKFVSSFKPNELEGWYDGFSVFYIHSDGLVHKHIVDKMIPDSDEKVAENSFQNNLAGKLAMVLGVVMKDVPSISN